MAGEKYSVPIQETARPAQEENDANESLMSEVVLQQAKAKKERLKKMENLASSFFCGE